MQYSFPAPTIIEITIVILFQSSVRLIDRKRSLIRIVNRLDFRIIKVSLSQLSSFKYFSRRKRRKRKKTTYRRDSRGTATLVEKHPTHSPPPLVPEIDKNLEYRGTIAATFCPTGGWNGGSTRYWKSYRNCTLFTP